MDVSVRVEVGILLARYSKYFDGGRTWVMLQLPPEATVADMVEILGIPPGCVSFPAVNGERVDFAWKLCPGDEIILFPYIAGG